MVLMLLWEIFSLAVSLQDMKCWQESAALGALTHALPYSNLRERLLLPWQSS